MFGCTFSFTWRVAKQVEDPELALCVVASVTCVVHGARMMPYKVQVYDVEGS